MSKVRLREVALMKVSEYVCEEFGLSDDYVITDFKAKSNSITLANQNHEITVKVTGEASYVLQNAIVEAIDEIKCGATEEE